nr:hypothetical protein [uncultured Sphingorhabdus sp.]
MRSSHNNTASDVWADTAYGSKVNETWLAAHGRHRKKPNGKPVSEALGAGDRTKAKIRTRCSA